MPPRQKQLLIGLAAAVLLWQGGIWANALFFAPLNELRTEVNRRRQIVADKNDQLLAIELAEGKLRNWKQRCLVPDGARKGVRPDAVEAQRQYTEWLTELARASGFDEVAVTPQRRSVSRNNVYIEVVALVEGEGRLSKVCDFLDRFYRTDMLHRIGRLQFVSQDVVGDPPIRFTLEAQALALANADPRRVFPHAQLAEALDAEATKLRVVSAAEFPKQAPFRIRLESELLDVTAISKEQWTVTRGVERTERVDHPERTLVALAPLRKSTPELTSEAFREYVRTNLFIKPAPPIEYDFQFGPHQPPVVVRGQAWEFSIAAINYDPARGEPKYGLLEKPPAGLTLNTETGLLRWKTDSKLAAGKYSVPIEVRHPSCPDGQQQQTLTLTLAEPNSSPRFPSLGTHKIFRGSPWKYKVTAKDADQPAQRLTYKLGAGTPPGAVINAKTGELTWTPREDQPLGPATLSVTVTDDGTPEKSTTASLSLQVQEDTAKLTSIIGIVAVGEKREAWLFDQAEKVKSVYAVGEMIRLSEIQAKIIEIDAEAVVVEFEKSTRRLKLGDTIRSLTLPPTPADSVETPR